MKDITTAQAKVKNFLHGFREKEKAKLQPKKPAYVWKFDKENYRLKKVINGPEQLNLF